MLRQAQQTKSSSVTYGATSPKGGQNTLPTRKKNPPLLATGILFHEINFECISTAISIYFNQIDDNIIYQEIEYI
jgi:hypothetical protein